MIEVFKTNVQKESKANYIIKIIERQFPTYKINFDLEDCDKILRVEGQRLEPNRIIKEVELLGYHCVKLD